MLVQEALMLQDSQQKVLVEEICLFCNLYDLFTQYSVNEVAAQDEG